jgi:hypothetical protein
MNTTAGVTKVLLQDRSPKEPGKFMVKVAAKGWFTSSAANQAPGSTRLEVDVGGRCFSGAATRKVD